MKHFAHLLITITLCSTLLMALHSLTKPRNTKGIRKYLESLKLRNRKIRQDGQSLQDQNQRERSKKKLFERRRSFLSRSKLSQFPSSYISGN